MRLIKKFLRYFLGLNNDNRMTASSIPNKIQIKIADESLKWALIYSTFIAIAERKGRSEYIVHNNATCSFIDTGVRKFAVTNFHVIEKYRELKQEKANLILQVGSCIIDIEKSIIEENKRLDLVTFQIDDHIMDINKKQFCSCPNWPPKRAEKEENILYVGFPGKFRETKSTNELYFYVTAFFEVVTDCSEEHFSILIDRKLWTKRFGLKDISEFDNWGGFSGAGVFRLSEEKRVAFLEPLGVMFSACQSYEILLIRHIDFIDANGAIKK